MNIKYSDEFKRKALDYYAKYGSVKTRNKYKIPKGTLESWVRKYKNSSNIQIVKTNSKYTNMFKGNVIDNYKKEGFSLTRDKFDISETTLLRWIKLDKDGKLIKKGHIRKRHIDPIKQISRMTRDEVIDKLEYINKNDAYNPEIKFYKKLRYQMIYGQSKNPDNKLSINALCSIYKVSESGYYRWIQNGMNEFNKHDEFLEECIYKYHNQYPFLGSRRITRLIIEDYGVVYSFSKVYRYMKKLNIVPYASKKNSYNYKNNNPDLIKKNYLYENSTYIGDQLINRSNKVWVVDESFIIKPASKPHLAMKIIVIMDAFDRNILSWEFSHNKDLISSFHKALDGAIEQFGKPNILHSDNGSLYTAISTNKKLYELGIIKSFSEAYKPWQNGRMERWFGTLKNGCMYFKGMDRYDYYGKQQKVVEFIIFYNTKRYHDTIKDIPINFRNKNNKMKEEKYD